MKNPVHASLVVASLLLAPLAAHAQEGGSATSTKSFAVTGNVPALCSGGTLSGDGSFNLGVLVDLSTGLLRTDLNAPNRVLTGAFCSTQSTITVNATPLSAQNFTATPPAGFARQVNYVATASGWTNTAASFNTAASTNPSAVQTRAGAFTGDISVAIGGFATAGGNSLRLVGDTSYRGLVTVTLTAVQ